MSFRLAQPSLAFHTKAAPLATFGPTTFRRIRNGVLRQKMHFSNLRCRVLRKSRMTAKVARRPCGTQPLYDRSLTVSSAANKMPATAKKESLLWWRHPFYGMKWSQWHINWRELENKIPASREKGPAGVLRRLKEARCDPDVALRLAFLESSHKPPTQSELAKDNKRQQDIKRKLRQSRDHLRSAAFGFIEATLPEIAKGRKKAVQRILAQSQNHISKAAAALKSARSVAPLIFVQPEDIDSLRAQAALTGTQNVASCKRLQDLARMCDHELKVLLWADAVELHPGHELFTLVSYVTACSGKPQYRLVTDLLTVAYGANTRTAPSQDVIEKQVERFRKLDSPQPELIAESMAQRAKSGELRRELTTWYPA
jgi:hypothetical protein